MGSRISGLKRVDRALTRLALVVEPHHRKRLLQVAGTAIVRYIHTCFAREAAPEWPAESDRPGQTRVVRQAAGRSWVPLAAATVARRRKGKYKRGRVRILRDTGNLYRSVNAFTTWDYVEVGTREPYGRRHQFGGRHLPARPFVGWEPAGAQRFVGYVYDRIRRAV